MNIAWFFGKAGAFVFGSGLAIVLFLFGGVVRHHQWLTEQQFLDAVAVALIAPGPVVITVAFIGYLIAGLPGATVAALATFLPCYLFTVLPAPLLRRYGRLPALTAAVQCITVAAVGAIAGAVAVLGKRSISDPLTLTIAVATYLVLWKDLAGRRVPEPVIVGGRSPARARPLPAALLTGRMRTTTTSSCTPPRRTGAGDSTHRLRSDGRHWGRWRTRPRQAGLSFARMIGGWCECVIWVLTAPVGPGGEIGLSGS